MKSLLCIQFYYYIQLDEQKRRATMHIPRNPGEQVEVDWAGDPAHIIDPDTGEITDVNHQRSDWAPLKSSFIRFLLTGSVFYFKNAVPKVSIFVIKKGRKSIITDFLPILNYMLSPILQT